jgi:hypothetical protein
VKQPINRLLMLGKRGLGGPIFQRIGQRLYAIGPPGNRTGIRVLGGLSASSTEGTNPAALTITIDATNEDGDPLAWSLSESLTWASFSPTSGTGETSVTVTLDPVGAGLAPGAYEGEFTITAAGAENSPYTGTLRMTYYATPVLAVTPVSLDFGLITEGDGFPVAQTLTVSNHAAPAGPMPFTAAGPVWLDVSQSGATVTVRPNTDVVGTYSDDVTITAASASNSPWVVPVTFDVQAPATIVLSESTLAFAAETGGAPANQTVTVTNGGDAPLSFTVSDNAPWLTVTPTSGTDGQVLTVSCSAQANVGNYSATITISDQSASNSPQTIAVSYTVSEPAGVIWEDDFDRADATGIANVGNGWEVATFATGHADLNIVSGALQIVGGSGYGLTFNPANGLAPSDFLLEVDIPSLTDSTYFGVCLRYDNVTNEGAKVIFTANDVTLNIGSTLGPSVDSVASTTHTAPAAGWSQSGPNTLGIKVEGASFELYLNGVLWKSATLSIDTYEGAGKAIGFCGEADNRFWNAIRILPLP